jgi:hypothetical protein
LWQRVLLSVWGRGQQPAAALPPHHQTYPQTAPQPQPHHSWSQRLPAGAPAKGEQFWGDARARAMLREFMAAVIGRVNTLTGVAYRYVRLLRWGCGCGCGCGVVVFLCVVD